MIYLDYAATTPIHKEVLKTYTGLLEKYYGNPDSNHPIGVEVHRLLSQSREIIGSLLHVKGNEIIFTSGASEANNLAIKGIAFQYQSRGKHLITSCVEHATVLHACKQLEEVFGFEVTYLPVDIHGCVSLQQVKEAVRQDTILVSLMFVNNEIGSVNPIHSIGAWLKKHTRAFFHSDFVQAVGKYELPTSVVDLATLSAHKIYGLKGSGVLLKKENVLLFPLFSGGDQEFGLRAGTNNAPVNIVFAKTLRLALEAQATQVDYVSSLRQELVALLMEIPGIVMNSALQASPFIINFQTPLPSEIMMNALSNKGYCVSAKSTCATRFAQASHVLLAIGLSKEQALHSIRISLGSEVEKNELIDFATDVKCLIGQYRT